MDVTDASAFEVVEQSQVSDARRRIVNIANQHGLDQKTQERIALVVTELATNLVKHTSCGGKLLVQVLNEAHRSGIEVFSVDNGQGMDLSRCMEDGYSTSQTLGTGLGAAKRMADVFDIYSRQGLGSVVNATFWSEKRQSNNRVIGGLSVPKPGELMSGDKWCVAETDDVIYCILVDGLGHGLEAAEAALLAIRRFKDNLHLLPIELLKLVHTSLRGSRGAVGAVARIDRKGCTLKYAGLGNIVGVLLSSSESKHLVSLNGTLGYEARKIIDTTAAWTPDSVLIMHSDGIQSKASEDVLDIRDKSASLIAGWLYQRHTKSIDDSTIVIIKGDGR